MRSCTSPPSFHMLTPRAETKFHVKPLPHARIPIVKLSLDPSPGLPLGIACDIGFENRLALENTRLLYCYAMIDPTRVRTMVLFRKCTCAVSLRSLLMSYPLSVKVWAKRRYACYRRYCLKHLLTTVEKSTRPIKEHSHLMATFFSSSIFWSTSRIHLYYQTYSKCPRSVQYLRRIRTLGAIMSGRQLAVSELSHEAENGLRFFDDIELLRQRWQSANQESVAQL